jgi:hypothetical protein
VERPAAVRCTFRRASHLTGPVLPRMSRDTRPLKSSRRGPRFLGWSCVSRFERLKSPACGTPRRPAHAEVLQPRLARPLGHPRASRSWTTNWVTGPRATPRTQPPGPFGLSRATPGSRWRGRQLRDGHVPIGVPISQCRSSYRVSRSAGPKSPLPAARYLPPPSPVRGLQAARPPRLRGSCGKHAGRCHGRARQLRALVTTARARHR